MKKKLTLTIDKEVIDLAKEHARKKGKNVSSIVESYLKSLINQDDGEVIISSKVRKMMGVIKLPEHYDYKKELGEAIL